MPRLTRPRFRTRPEWKGPESAACGFSHRRERPNHFEGHLRYVDSRFDIQTERDLDAWNKLKRDEVSGKLTEAGAQRLVELTTILSERSEELRSIVASPLTIPKSVLDSLVSQGSRE